MVCVAHEMVEICKLAWKECRQPSKLCTSGGDAVIFCVLLAPWCIGRYLVLGVFLAFSKSSKFTFFLLANSVCFRNR